MFLAFVSQEFQGISYGLKSMLLNGEVDEEVCIE